MITYEQILSAWQEKKISSVTDMDAALADYRIFFAYHSNKIEDAGVSLHQTREIFENGKVVGYTGDLRALFETQNQKICSEFLKDKIVAKKALTSELIKEIHEKLCHGCYDERRWDKGERPGEYKKSSYWVGMDVGVPPEDVEEEVTFICNELSDATLDSAEDVLKAAAWFHCSFERIHAFADGNGRVGRTLLNYVLMVGNLPPVIIFDEDKETYYMGLEVFDHSDKIDGFVQFLEEQTVKTWTRTDLKGKQFIAM